MNRLPVLNLANRAFHFLLSDESAAHIAGLLIDSSPAAAARFAADLAMDPALTLWIQCAARDTRLTDFMAMADWFAGPGRRRLAAARDAVSYAVADEPRVRLRAAELSAQSIAAAELSPASTATDRLIALAHNAQAWLQWAERPAAGEAAGDLLPQWLAQAIADRSIRDCDAADRSEASRRPIDRARSAWLNSGVAALPLCELAAQSERLVSLEQQFHECLEREKLESLAEFSAGAGHEINNPLAVISGRAQLLLEGEQHPERRRDLATIHGQARRVHEMILDLMLFARPPAPRFAAIDLGELIERVTHEAQRSFTDRQVELAWQCVPRPLMVLADATQLAAALKALIDNALQATRAGGRVEIDVRHSPEHQPQMAVLTVTDNGSGMPPDVRRHAFDPYYSGRSAGRGLGLGLSKCWRIVTNHGGIIRIDSPGETGTRITIELPCADASPADREATSMPRGEPASDSAD